MGGGGEAEDGGKKGGVLQRAGHTGRLKELLLLLIV